jgi:hypothetical protein
MTLNRPATRQQPANNIPLHQRALNVCRNVRCASFTCYGLRYQYRGVMMTLVMVTCFAFVDVGIRPTFPAAPYTLFLFFVQNHTRGFRKRGSRSMAVRFTVMPRCQCIRIRHITISHFDAETVLMIQMLRSMHIKSSST